MLEEFGEILSLDESSGVLVSLAEGQTCSEDVGVLPKSVSQSLIAQVFLVTDDITPVLSPCHRVECSGVVADGIESADDATHRRACNDINGNACLFQYFQDSDVGHTLCTASTEDDSYTFPAD